MRYGVEPRPSRKSSFVIRKRPGYVLRYIESCLMLIGHCHGVIAVRRGAIWGAMWPPPNRGPPSADPASGRAGGGHGHVADSVG